MRKVVFANGEFYHLYNRGVDKRKVFLHYGHYVRFIKTINNILKTGSAQSKIFIDKSSALNLKLSFISYCLMPNHYHFLVRQKKSGAITEFMHCLDTSYTKYFNLNNKRTGRLFEYTFKAVHIINEDLLLHVSRYIHLNPITSNLTKKLSSYKWSSYPDFIGQRDGKLCQKEEVLGLFSNNNKFKAYESFVLNQVDYQKTLDYIKKAIIE